MLGLVFFYFRVGWGFMIIWGLLESDIDDRVGMLRFRLNSNMWGFWGKFGNLVYLRFIGS